MIFNDSPFGGRADRWRMRIVLPAAALCLLLSGCSGDDKATADSTASPETFPNLATVPDEPPPATPRVERERLIQGLMADRANAAYTDQPLGEATARVPPAAPPPPAPPQPSAEEGEASSAAEADSAPAETPPAEVAALPADLGQPTALIYFAGDAATLTDLDRAVLNDVAAMYARQRGSRVRIIGHVSSSETRASATAGGLDLAMARADAVAQTLVAMGIPAEVMETAAGGATYDESLPNGVAANRRVEVYIGS